MLQLRRRVARAVIVGAAGLVMASPAGYAFDYDLDQFNGVKFSLDTDKNTYATFDPIRVEVSAENSTDEPLEFDYNTLYQGQHRYSLTSVSVKDIATDEYVLFNQTLKKLNKVMVPPNSRIAFAMGDLPANKLLGGNKKYLVTVRLAVPLKCGAQGRHCGQIDTEASTVITVR